jgi:hypothetical protein
MPVERLAQEPFGGSQIAPFAGPELDGVAVAVDSPMEIRPASTDLAVSFIHVPFAGDRALAPVELLQQERDVVNRPAVDSGIIHVDPSFGHHLFEVSQAQAIGQIPPDRAGSMIDQNALLGRRGRECIHECDYAARASEQQLAERQLQCASC